MKQQTTVGGRECLLYTDGRAGGQQCPCGICASDGAPRYRQMNARMEPRQSFRRWSHPHSQRLCVVPFKTEKQSCQQRNIKEYIDRFMIKIQGTDNCARTARRTVSVMCVMMILYAPSMVSCRWWSIISTTRPSPNPHRNKQPPPVHGKLMTDSNRIRP